MKTRVATLIKNLGLGNRKATTSISSDLCHVKVNLIFSRISCYSNYFYYKGSEVTFLNSLLCLSKFKAVVPVRGAGADGRLSHCLCRVRCNRVSATVAE